MSTSQYSTWRRTASMSNIGSLFQGLDRTPLPAYKVSASVDISHSTPLRQEVNISRAISRKIRKVSKAIKVPKKKQDTKKENSKTKRDPTKSSVRSKPRKFNSDIFQ